MFTEVTPVADAPFDAEATTYDAAFTETIVGKLQRARVWQYLDQCMPALPLNVLEINCGTGTDAYHLASKGNRVTATDASAAMIKQALSKASNQTGSCTFETCAFENLAGR